MLRSIPIHPRGLRSLERQPPILAVHTSIVCYKHNAMGVTLGPTANNLSRKARKGRKEGHVTTYPSVPKGQKRTVDLKLHLSDRLSP